MAGRRQLILAGLVEKDSHGDVLWVWSYPTVTTDVRELCLRKCPLSWGERNDWPELAFSQYQSQWYYFYTSEEQTESLPKVVGVSLVLAAQDFHPEKYYVLSQLMLKRYTMTGSPAQLLERYLGVLTKGSCPGTDNDNGMLVVSEYDARNAYVASAVRDVIVQFGIETILIYTALMLKKRVVVYHSKLRPLLAFTRALPALVWHRQDWTILHPWLSLDDIEVSDLQKKSSYVAGFTESTVEMRSDLYDILVNLTTSEVVISPRAKDTFTMGKLHKDIAMFLVNCAEDTDKSQQQVIKDIALKTKELLSNLKSLATVGDDGKPVVTLEALRQRKMPAATENFLFSLAAAEGMVTT